MLLDENGKINIQQLVLKLFLDFFNKKNCVLQYKKLKFHLQHGMVDKRLYIVFLCSSNDHG